MPTNSVIRIEPEPGEHDAGVARLRRPEGGHAVGHRLDAGERGAAGGERAQHQEEGQVLGHREIGGRRRRSLPSRHPPDEAVGEHAPEAHHEEVGRDREEIARLPQAPKVHGRDPGDEEHAERDAIVVEDGERGGDGGHARGHAHRDRQHVVDEQRGPGDEPGHLAQVVLGDDVGAAALGIGQDGLPVRADHDRDQHRDREPDRNRVDERGGARDHQDQQDLLGGVRHRGERVGREDRERGRLREPLVPGLRRSER